MKITFKRNVDSVADLEDGLLTFLLHTSRLPQLNQTGNCRNLYTNAFSYKLVCMHE
jgi:hypothetical protein